MPVRACRQFRGDRDGRVSAYIHRDVANASVSAGLEAAQREPRTAHVWALETHKGPRLNASRHIAAPHTASRITASVERARKIEVGTPEMGSAEL